MIVRTARGGPAKNKLKMVLFSRCSLTPEMSAQQLSALSDFQNGLMCPDRWGRYEPIRSVFDPRDLTEPIKALAQPHGCFLFVKGRPALMDGSIWNLTHPPEATFPGPAFSNYWHADIDGRWAERVGLSVVEQFVKEMFNVAKADFGLLTTDADLSAKNRDSNHFSYQGMNLDTGLPGLYWINLFSEDLATWLGLKDVPIELAESTSQRANAICLKFSESYDHCRDVDVLARQKPTIQFLGEDRFFDIRFLDRKLKMRDRFASVPSQED